MKPISDRSRIRFPAWPLVDFLTTIVALGACSSTAAPTSSATAAIPTTTPVVTATASPSPTPATTTSPTAVVAKISPIPGAPDSKTVVQLVAVKTKWDPTTLTAPAGEVWHVKIDDKDALPTKHNFTVASGPTFSERIFQVPNIAGLNTFDVPGLPAGSYLFICTIHPESMTGTLTLK